MKLRACLLVALMFSATRAYAEKDESAAKVHFLAGQAYYQQSNFADAIREFSESYKLSKKPALLYNVAGCYERMGRLSEAAQALEDYLKATPDAADRVTIEARIRALRERSPLRKPEAASSSQDGSGTRRQLFGRVALGLGLGGGALVLTGIGTGAAALARDDHKLAIGTDVLLFIGGAAVVTSIVLILLRPKEKKLAFGPGALGITF